MLSQNCLLKECVGRVADRIESQSEQLSNRELMRLCESAGDILSGKVNPHLYHEIVETAVNHIIRQKYAALIVDQQNQPLETLREVIRPLVAKLPTQTWRSDQQNALQQFSTPPAIAFLLTYLLDLQPGEIVLEPSAGTGSLAAWVGGGELQIHANEIDARRGELLRCLGFAPTAHNAEFIDDLLEPAIQPDCVLMNPPFSANNGRTKEKSSKFGFRHVESALSRLKKGGKFGIILGNSAGLDTKTGDEFWRKMSATTSVTAIIKVAGREYYKNGTSVDINLIVGKKNRTEQPFDWNGAKSRITNVSAASVEDAFTAATNLNLRLD